MREIVSQSAFDGVWGTELSPGEAVSTDAQIAEATAASAITGHHPIGTCKMGIDTDPMAVVDGELRVRGVKKTARCRALRMQSFAQRETVLRCRGKTFDTGSPFPRK